MELGAYGEAVAAAYLERRGYRIVDTNVHFGPKSGLKGEIDIVAWDGETLAIIEVKTRRGQPGRVFPLENVTPAKQRQLVALAQTYAAQHALLGEVPLRFDVVGVIVGEGDPPRVLRVTLIPGAFWQEDDS